MSKIAPLAFGLIAALALACATTEKPKAKLAPAPSPAPAVAAAPAPSAGGSVSAGPAAPTLPIYFDFDSDQLTPSSQESLKQMAGYLAANAGSMLTIEGHCDETGSSEYNLALGDRRARAAVEYLEALGVTGTRLKSISFGEERPAVVGNDDAAHQKNRRGNYDLKAAAG
ncbi:MAG: OmpA family protein [Deltaproteobacteria bacterium]|nr:OmpA family protein [Deltaproteobacteria bacterium]